MTLIYFVAYALLIYPVAIMRIGHYASVVVNIEVLVLDILDAYERRALRDGNENMSLLRNAALGIADEGHPLQFCFNLAGIRSHDRLPQRIYATFFEKSLYLALCEETMGILVGYANGHLLAVLYGCSRLVPRCYSQNKINTDDDVGDYVKGFLHLLLLNDFRYFRNIVVKVSGSEDDEDVKVA